MSHASLLVISNTKDEAEIARLLAPYDENLAVPEYFVPLDDFDKKYLAEKTGKVNFTLKDLDEHLDEDSYRYGPDGVTFGRMSTYNPQSKWDWWVIGGRWENSLVSNDPGLARSRECDQSRKRYINWDAMGAKQVAERRESWAKAHTEERYKDNPMLWQVLFGIEVDDTEDSYLRRGVSFITFAIVSADGWAERGKLGLFGAVHNEQEEWPDTWKRIVDAADPDSWFSIIDYHI